MSTTTDAFLPDLDSLRCFLAATEQETFRAAAAAVALSPAAFSERISRLEELLGEQLFERGGRKVQLTLAGERLLPEARSTLHHARRCRQAVCDPEQRPPFALTIGTRYELGLSWLVPALGPLKAQRPERSLHLYFGQHGDLLQRLLASQIDALVTSARLVHGGLRYVLLHEEDYVFVGVPSLGAGFGGSADAARNTLLDAEPSLPLFRYLLDRMSGADDWPWAGVEYLGTIAAIRHRLLDGAGLAVLPRYFVEQDLQAGRLVELLPELRPREDAFRLVWRENDPRDEELRLLGEELRALPLR